MKKINNFHFNILITKSLDDEFIVLVKNRTNIIIRESIIRYGGSKLEPNVLKPDWSIGQLCKLIEAGFPSKRIVLRVSLIFTTDKGRIKVPPVALTLAQADSLYRFISRNPYTTFESSNHGK